MTIVLTACGSAPVAQSSFGTDQVQTRAAGAGWQVTITDASGAVYVVDVTVAGGAATLTWTAPGRAPLGPMALDSAPADSDGAARGAYFAHAQALAATAITPQSFTGASTVYNTAGCDTIHYFDCRQYPNETNKGGACDQHDECITQNCGGCGDSGNVVDCLTRGQPKSPCSAACLRCHLDVMRRFWDATDYGESACCGRGDCGRAQECMIDGVTITDACECAHHAPPVTSVHGCEPCIANGQPLANGSTPCCSGLTCGIGSGSTGYCCGAPAYSANQCGGGANDCNSGFGCAGGRCCLPSGAPSPPGTCFCCSGKDDGAGHCA